MADIARGRRLILGIVGATGIFMAVIALGVWLQGAPFRPLTLLGRPIVLAILGVLAYRGVFWARGAIVFWLGLMAIGYAIGGVVVIGETVLWGLLSLLLAASLTYGAVVLYTSDDVEQVFEPETRRRDRAAPTPLG